MESRAAVRSVAHNQRKDTQTREGERCKQEIRERERERILLECENRVRLSERILTCQLSGMFLYGLCKCCNGVVMLIEYREECLPRGGVERHAEGCRSIFCICSGAVGGRGREGKGRRREWNPALTHTGRGLWVVEQ